MTSAAPIANSNALVVPGRECGSCSMCCKVYNIPEINKPAGKWCTHCKPGNGCAIHNALPEQCAEFNCLWRTEASIGPAWKPDQSRMVVTINPFSGFIYVQVDANAPSAWRKQPYLGQLQQWARNNLPKGIYVIVFVNEHATLIMPDGDVPLGPMMPTDGLAVRRNGNAYEARLIPGGATMPPMPAPG
ncbi:MAG TPA: hypothetical protein VNY08_19365 [Bradyrhizobium sp.]|jgi:hypothetical protein|nr:hypothetical protein [Bradyrhizobium sp.]